MSAGIQPGHAPPHHHNFELAILQVGPVDVGDLEFTPRARLQRFRDLHYLVIVKIKPSDRISRFRLRWLFFDAQCASVGVKRHHTVPLRIMHRISEDSRPMNFARRLSQILRQIMPVKNVVPQHEGARTTVQKFFR